MVLREFDLTAQIFVEEGFIPPEAKGGIDWLDRDHLLLSDTYDQGMVTTSGYSRTVRLWRRGESVENASVLLETDRAQVSVSAGFARASQMNVCISASGWISSMLAGS